MNRGALAGQPTRLGDVLRIKHGFAFKGEFFSDEPGKVILTPGNFDEAGGLKFRAEKDRSYIGAYPSEFELKAGNLLVVMADLTQEARILGAPAFVPPDVKCLHNQRLGKIVDLDTERLDRRFLYHLMNGPDYRRALKATATGSTVRHTSPGRIYDFQVCLPEISEQRRIASILSAYDDLIDVNRRRVAILENMARRLFEEWFVHRRFPGHQAVSLHNTPGGPLPDGWQNSCADALIAFDPPTSAGSADSRFVPMAALTTDTASITFYEKRSGRSGARFLAGDTLFARVTPCMENGKTALVPTLDSDSPVGVGSTEFIVMRPKLAGVAYTYCLARHSGFRSHARASMSGATVGSVCGLSTCGVME